MSEEIQQLHVHCDQMAAHTEHPGVIRAGLMTLREGLERLEERLSRLHEENDRLRASRRALESQVMDMAHQADQERNRYEKIMFLFADDDPDLDLLGA